MKPIIMLFCICTVCMGHAQWSTDPMVNTVVCANVNGQSSALITDDGAGGAKF